MSLRGNHGKAYKWCKKNERNRRVLLKSMTVFS